MSTVQPIRSKKKLDAMKRQLKGDVRNGDRNYMIFCFGINTGLRISDILKLRVKDVASRDHITMTEQKTGKPKRFPLNSMLQKELKTYIEQHSLTDEDYLFTGRKGSKPITRIQAYRVLNDAAKDIGLEEIGTHTLRKTFGYHFYKQYHDVVLLQRIYNHASPSITLRYIGINDDEIQDSINNFYL